MGKHKSNEVINEAIPAKRSFVSHVDSTDMPSTSSPPTIERKQDRLFDCLPPEVNDLILQHLRLKFVLNLSGVSQTWHQVIGNSPVVMKKTIVKYEHESKSIISQSSRKYRHIEIKQRYSNQENTFLEGILNIFSPSLRTLSFEGIYKKSWIDEFFSKLKEKFSSPNDFSVENLRFVGNVENIETILFGFHTILRHMKIVYGSEVDAFESIELSSLSTETFAKTLKYLPTKKLVLNDMVIEKLPGDAFYYQNFIEELKLSLTKIDAFSAKLLLNMFEYSGTLKRLVIDDRGSLDSRVNEIFTSYSNRSDLSIQNESGIEVPGIASVHSDVHMAVFQHLSCEELLNLSTVSKKWFKLTTEAIERRSIFDSLNSAEIRAERKRFYRNIHATVDPNISSLENIISFTPYLTEIYLEVLAGSFENVLTLFSEANKFPNLSLLEIACHENSPLDNLMLPTSLKTLQMTDFTLTDSKPDQTRFFDFLCKSRSLVELKFFESFGLDNLFTTDVSEKFNFKLSTLKLPILKRVSEVQETFNKFLVSQKQSLENLHLHKMSNSTLCLITRELKLKSFGFLHLEESIDRFKGPMDPMETLTDFQLPQVKCDCIQKLNFLRSLMILAPNMKTVLVYRLTKKILFFLSENFNLKEIRYDKKWLKGVEMQNEHCYNDIQLIPGDVVFEEFA